jgi:hypothetical protein
VARSESTGPPRGGPRQNAEAGRYASHGSLDSTRVAVVESTQVLGVLTVGSERQLVISYTGAIVTCRPVVTRTRPDPRSGCMCLSPSRKHRQRFAAGTRAASSRCAPRLLTQMADVASHRRLRGAARDAPAHARRHAGCATAIIAERTTRTARRRRTGPGREGAGRHLRRRGRRCRSLVTPAPADRCASPCRCRRHAR